jgi:hypothetical protein
VTGRVTAPVTAARPVRFDLYGQLPALLLEGWDKWVMPVATQAGGERWVSTFTGSRRGDRAFAQAFAADIVGATGGMIAEVWS